LPDLQGIALCSKEAYADLIFCYFFIKKKVVAPAAMSGELLIEPQNISQTSINHQTFLFLTF